MELFHFRFSDEDEDSHDFFAFCDDKKRKRRTDKNDTKRHCPSTVDKNEKIHQIDVVTHSAFNTLANFSSNLNAKDNVQKPVTTKRPR